MGKNTITNSSETINNIYKHLDDFHLAPGKRYVFYTSLQNQTERYQKLYKKANTMIDNYAKEFKISSKNNENSKRIKEALAFLKNSAEFERTKELQFF